MEIICVNAALAVVLITGFFDVRWIWKHARTARSRFASWISNCSDVTATSSVFITCSCTASSYSSEHLQTASIMAVPSAATSASAMALSSFSALRIPCSVCEARR